MSNEAKSNLRASEETRRSSASTGAPCATRMVRKEDWERGLGEGTYCEGYRTIKGLSFRSAQEYSSLEEEERGRRRRGQLRPRRKNRLSANVPYICPRQSRSAQPAANCTIAQAIHRKRIVAARVSPFPNTLYHVILPFFFFLSFFSGPNDHTVELAPPYLSAYFRILFYARNNQGKNERPSKVYIQRSTVAKSRSGGIVVKRLRDRSSDSLS